VSFYALSLAVSPCIQCLFVRIPNWNTVIEAVAVLGFCVWGTNGAGIFVWGAKRRLSAEGAKLRLPKARSASRLGGLRDRGAS